VILEVKALKSCATLLNTRNFLNMSFKSSFVGDVAAGNLWAPRGGLFNCFFQFIGPIHFTHEASSPRRYNPRRRWLLKSIPTT
jgi:hypothetical protein